jgi:hypothetical protein
MTHPVSGFDLKFTNRRSWKAERRYAGRLIDVVPVTWTKGRRSENGEIFQEVWYQDKEEMEARRTDPTPFVVALAIAKDYSIQPHAFDAFRCLYKVSATGAVLSDRSIETKVLERVRA